MLAEKRVSVGGMLDLVRRSFPNSSSTPTNHQNYKNQQHQLELNQHKKNNIRELEELFIKNRCNDSLLMEKSQNDLNKSKKQNENDQYYCQQNKPPAGAIVRRRSRPRSLNLCLFSGRANTDGVKAIPTDTWVFKRCAKRY